MLVKGSIIGLRMPEYVKKEKEKSSVDQKRLKMLESAYCPEVEVEGEFKNLYGRLTS